MTESKNNLNSKYRIKHSAGAVNKLNSIDMMENKIKIINRVIEEYFTENPQVIWIKAKKIMPDLIKAGVFIKDNKAGKPLRDILRELDGNNALNKIPFVHAERIDKNTYWYIVRSGGEYTPTEAIPKVTRKQFAKNKRDSSDEYYIIDLCDEILGLNAARQKTFSFLVGDLHKDGVTRTRLPLDAYYESLNLVVEFLEKQHTEEVSHFDKLERVTVSGVSRGEQRKIYDQRRRTVLKNKEIDLVEVDYSLFEVDSNKKLHRNKEKDIVVLSQLLSKYI